MDAFRPVTPCQGVDETMSAPAQERPPFDARRDCARGHREKTSAEGEPDVPPLLLAGTDDDGTEPHICRGID
jgi:hypothetical protein